MGVIKDMFHGDTSSEFMPVSEASRELIDKLITCENSITELIEDKNRAGDLLSEWRAAEMELSGSYNDDCFEFGYILGARMMLEILKGR